MSDVVEEQLQRFRNAPRAQPAWGTAHIRKALVELGDPQDRIPPAIHITGTNGKGSTGAFIRAMAEAAGLKVHVFTSPHLIRVNERIRVASRLVEDRQLADVLEDIGRRTAGLTYFEALTAAAFCLFAQEKADLAIVEVGAGGETDATNVMTRPAACVVTPISRDHEGLFGVSGLAAIARLKAGIFREGVPAVLAEQPAIASAVLKEEGRLAGARVVEAGEDWTEHWDGEAFVYEGERVKLRTPWLGLPGRHQAQNAAAACATLEAVKALKITTDAMTTGLREATWPARLQRLKPGPLTGGNGAPIIVDAAHNPGGAAALAEAIAGMRAGAGERIVAVFAIQAAKDVEGVLAALAPAVDGLVACPLPDSGGQEGGPGADPEDTARIARALGTGTQTAGSLEDAVDLARKTGASRIIIAGSVYLCGAAFEANGERVD